MYKNWDSIFLVTLFLEILGKNGRRKLGRRFLSQQAGGERRASAHRGETSPQRADVFQHYRRLEHRRHGDVWEPRRRRLDSDVPEVRYEEYEQEMI